MREEQASKIGMHALITVMSSLEKVSLGISPRFLSQKIDANEPEKKMP
jgi:hypothetical protein